jgi:predicted RNase H-like nuclease (RuvC/YqgF family)
MNKLPRTKKIERLEKSLKNRMRIHKKDVSLLQEKNQSLTAEIEALKKQLEEVKKNSLHVTEACKKPENVIVCTTAKGRIIKFCHGAYGNGNLEISEFKLNQIKNLES